MAIERRVATIGALPVVVELADPASAAQLERVAGRLARASHPGVVEVVESGATPDGGWRLVSAHGGGPASTLVGLDPSRLAALGAAVAATLADLHDLGVVHGRLTEHRILIGSDGRPIVCGFGPEATGRVPEDDVAGLGAALVELFANLAPGGHPIAGRRANDATRALQRVLEDATLSDASRRPSMRRLAAALAEVSSPGLGTSGSRPRPKIAAPSSDAPARRFATGRVPIVVVGGLLACAVAGVLLTRFPHGDVSADPIPAPAAPATTSATTSASARRAVVSSDGSSRCLVIGDQQPAEAMAGCSHRVSISGRIVTIDGQRYEVGEPGDLLAVGSFGCQGDATVVVLRPRTGAVFAFGEVGDVPQDVPAVATVPGGVRLRGFHVSDRCHRLDVVAADGSSVAVDLLDRT